MYFIDLETNQPQYELSEEEKRDYEKALARGEDPHGIDYEEFYKWYENMKNKER